MSTINAVVRHTNHKGDMWSCISHSQMWCLISSTTRTWLVVPMKYRHLNSTLWLVSLVGRWQLNIVQLVGLWLIRLDLSGRLVMWWKIVTPTCPMWSRVMLRCQSKSRRIKRDQRDIRFRLEFTWVWSNQLNTFLPKSRVYPITSQLLWLRLVHQPHPRLNLGCARTHILRGPLRMRGHRDKEATWPLHSWDHFS